MILCDYCDQPVKRDEHTHMGLPGDYHPECAKAWAEEAKKIKGQRPPKSDT